MNKLKNSFLFHSLTIPIIPTTKIHKFSQTQVRQLVQARLTRLKLMRSSPAWLFDDQDDYRVADLLRDFMREMVTMSNDDYRKTLALVMIPICRERK